jgi:hypothetical protein
LAKRAAWAKIFDPAAAKAKAMTEAVIGAGKLPPGMTRDELWWQLLCRCVTEAKIAAGMMAPSAAIDPETGLTQAEAARRPAEARRLRDMTFRVHGVDD